MAIPILYDNRHVLKSSNIGVVKELSNNNQCINKNNHNEAKAPNSKFYTRRRQECELLNGTSLEENMHIVLNSFRIINITLVLM